MHSEDGSRIAVVTGGTGALGGAVVEALLASGYRVHVPWRSEAEAENLRSRLREGSRNLRLSPADLSDEHQVADFFQPLAEAGELDLLCNLAGGFAYGGLEDTTVATWRRMIESNATSLFLATRAAVPILRARGGGSVVNVGALPPLEGRGAGMSAYVAAKAAVLALSRAWAHELKADGIRVNTIVPRTIDTPGNRRAMPDADPTAWVRPEEIARIVRFLAGEDARTLTGAVLTLDR